MTYRENCGKSHSEMAWDAMPAAEKRRIVEALRAACMNDADGVKRALYHLAVVRHRRMIDDERDRKSRVLVGARLDRQTAARVQRAARESGRSVYRFVADAIRRELFHFETECDTM